MHPQTLRADQTRADASHRQWEDRIVRLTDPGPAEELAKLRKRLLANPAEAREWLIKRGFMTAGGKLPKRYGG